MISQIWTPRVLRSRFSRTKVRSSARPHALSFDDPPAQTPDETPPAGASDPLDAGQTLGLALQAARLEKGLTLESVADITRVRRSYLEAIEDMRLDALPSRPFTIGYIRAYAETLGLDGERAVERFKTEQPVFDEPLHAPVGMLDDRDPRVAAALFAALVIVSAIILWNVAQRAMMANAPPPALASEAATRKVLGRASTGPITLGAPLPAPVESTTPPPYETPGLAEAMGLARDPTAPKPTNETPVLDLASLPQVFAAKGRVYDGGNGQISIVATVQALKNASLIVRGADGSVYFARQMATGEAYRVPQVAGLTLDVSAPQDFQVFVAGQSRGVLPSAQVLASKLAAPPAATAP